MKKIILLTFVLVWIMPTFLLYFFDSPNHSSELKNHHYEKESAMQDPEKTEPVESEPTVAVLKNDKIEYMQLEEYVLCVVLAEMPADFDIEALKAQAVVARTYTCRKIDDPKHMNASVCIDSGCCQAFMDEASYLFKGGTKENLQKVRAAVDSTAGEVLLYQGELIEATYFSCSGGKTEDAAAVWGADVPYLQSVDSPGEELASHYTDTVRFSVKELCNQLDLSLSQAVLVENITYTSGGGVESISIQGKSFTGTQIREKLGLRSTAFVITVAGDTVTVTTKGFGHRVGMSQYGAEAMAVNGSSYEEILTHYYTDAAVSDLSG